MATTNNKGTSKKTSTAKKTVSSAPKAEDTVVEKNAPAKKVKKQVELNDLVKVVSCFYGRLVYVSRKTGYQTIWSEFGDFEMMPVEELMSMRNSQRGFFENHWITLAGDNAEDVIKYLRLEQYYKDIASVDDIDNLFGNAPDELPGILQRFTPAARETIARRAYELVQEGVLTDINVIRALETELGYDLSH